MRFEELPRAGFAQTDIYFAAVWFAFCIGIVFGFVLAGGFDAERPNQEDKTTADT